MFVYSKTVKVMDIPEGNVQLVTDSQEISYYLLDYLPDAMETPGAIFVEAADGEINRLWLLDSNVPYLHYNADEYIPAAYAVNVGMSGYIPESQYHAATFEQAKVIFDTEIDAYIDVGWKVERVSDTYAVLCPPWTGDCQSSIWYISIEEV